MISLKTHNILDYVIGIVLILSPSIFGFSSVMAARNALVLYGLALIAYSLFTNYYYSVAKIISVRTHMALDATLGVVLLVSPWLIGYSTQLSGGQLTLHFFLGLGAIALATFTDRSMVKMEVLPRERSEDETHKAA